MGGTARRFYPGERITARRLNELVDATGRTPFAATAAPARNLRVKNESGAVVARFQALEITGFAFDSPTRDRAVESIAANGVELTGTTPTGAENAFLVVATEPIPIGETGAATFANGTAFVAEVVGLTDAAEYANPTANAATFDASEDSGAFRIVARSTSGICLLTPKAEPGGVLFGTVSQIQYESNGDVSAYLVENEDGLNYVCESPLDDPSFPLGVGQKVVFARSRYADAYYIINAENF